ncbi:hypothetical protein BDBG_17641 [Blastomyces gilchristii SLH14081]|uniref:Uncharacterized protein n=1 Tax=Blastomyces gilchristii (strain SLH14081) TaxID=559298 RepID=A0A179UVZ8_BLAGS|nr:uncharacterized protein BDBG_17641 [Blastomyces gilchristii SLH14081]OAT12276.1 hypothetical protein BDBG_17641 [Blastomyces gilchristii SLH14081]
MQEYAKDKKVSDFINLNKLNIFSELEEPLEPECSEEATAEVKIVYDIKITVWKIKYMKYEKLNKDLENINELFKFTLLSLKLLNL